VIEGTGDAVQRAVLRHLLATLAYRAAKTIRGAPPGFADFETGPATRTPQRIVAHMGDLMAWGLRTVRGDPSWKAEGGADWDVEVERFFDGLAALDHALAFEGPLGPRAEVLIQGPLADALTHVGQLAMLRGSFGAPIRPESFARAHIEAGRVGLDQEPPGHEFEGDASAPRRTPGS
jgi:hypothetical protein